MSRNRNPPTLWMGMQIGTTNMDNKYGALYGRSFKKVSIELLYDPAVPLLGIHPEKTII